ncbi:S1 RNA-binding domain-containing protein [Flavobacterium sp. ASW18X]|uniref:CvfB family protein n=1 Tax=Flavobacterium sp. ASW18X TaxID=2572595 RepID=UPI0010AE958D|nr:S1-like domain-containing RNA-binding protein [Flavobacterium sp. ASW18X]TKD66222.1 GntR family transcriptional regulator [Flavobacterium sp. ASW18X]
MIKIGDYNTLEVLRSTSVGIFLGDEEGTEILLPNKYVPENIEQGQMLNVFCYLDHMERPIATTLNPYIKRGDFSLLEVVEINNIGAFADWGLEKQLLIPYREQQTKVEEGKKYIVHCFMDEKSFRLVGSTKIDRFLDNAEMNLEIGQEVAILVYKKTELGWSVAINDKHQGLIFANEVFKQIAVGDRLTGYIKQIREDQKVDVSLQPTGVQLLDAAADTILSKLKQGHGFLPLHDKSSPDEIKRELELSKKAFKKGVGILYKKRLIVLEEDGIRLLAED